MVIDTFIGSGLPQTSAAASLSASAASTERPAAPRSRASATMRSARGSTRLMQRMAVAGEGFALIAMLARDRERGLAQRAASVGARQHVLDEPAAEVGGAQDHRAAAQHARRDRALKRGGIGVIGHARRLHRRRQAMLGERHQAQIEKETLLVGRRPAGREQEDELGERRAAHEVLGEVAPAHRHPLARGGRNRGRCLAALADQHARLLLKGRPLRLLMARETL